MGSTVKVLFLGIGIGILLSLIMGGVFHNIWENGSLGEDPYVRFDEKARDEIGWNGQPFPAAITDIYYYQEGMLNRTIFIAFSGPRQELDRLVEVKTGKKIAELSPWRGQIKKDDWTYKPGVHWPKFKTIFYNPDRVSKGLFMEIPGAEDGWHLLYDREGERVYYCERIGF